jgi:hypothetical protein
MHISQRKNLGLDCLAPLSMELGSLLKRHQRDHCERADRVRAGAHLHTNTKAGFV